MATLKQMADLKAKLTEAFQSAVAQGDSTQAEELSSALDTLKEAVREKRRASRDLNSAELVLTLHLSQLHFDEARNALESWTE